MKKFLGLFVFIFIIIGLFNSHKIYSNENKINFKGVEEVYRYVYNNPLYCDGYGFISNDYKNKEKINEFIAYLRLEEFCNEVKDGKESLDDVVEELFTKYPKNITSFYIYITKIIYKKNINIKKFDKYLISLLNIENFQIFRKDKLVFDFHKELVIALLKHYKNVDKLDKYIFYLKKGGRLIDMDLYYKNRVDYYVSKYGYIFSKLRKYTNINKYKNNIIYLYGEDYYNFIFNLGKLRNWFKYKNINLELEDVINSKNIVLNYYNLHKNEILKSFKEFNYTYDFNKDFFDVINNKIKLIKDNNNFGKEKKVNNLDKDNKKDLNKKYNENYILVILLLVFFGIIFIFYFISRKGINGGKNKTNG